MFDVIHVRAFKDNYIWLLRKGTDAVAVDPGDAGPVLDMLSREGLSLAAILVTHHHHDHQGGVAALRAQWPEVEVFAPVRESITAVSRPLEGGERIHIAALDSAFEVLAVPGHTLGHLAYVGADCLFCGDTLFGGGCGRLFEGTPEQMYASLSRLAGLPGSTRVFCAHEYTQANLRFALAVEPGNAVLQRRVAEIAAMRDRDLPTVPVALSVEHATNPFLRCTEPEVIRAACAHGAISTDPAAVFTALRAWKDAF